MIPPYPYYLGDPSTLSIIEDIESVWFGRPVLMFSCIFRPLGGAMESFKCNLIFFNTFQSLELASESQSPMQSDGGIRILYKPGQWDPAVGSSKKKPVLHVGYLEHVLCRAPLIPSWCFLDGNSTNTIPHSKGKKARGSPTKNATRTQEQAMEVLYLRWICHSGALEEETPEAWVSRRQRNCAQLEWLLQGNRLHQQKEGEISKQ